MVKVLCSFLFLYLLLYARRIRSSVVERCIHIADVRGSNPLGSTQSVQRGILLIRYPEHFLKVL